MSTDIISSNRQLQTTLSNDPFDDAPIIEIAADLQAEATLSVRKAAAPPGPGKSQHEPRCRCRSREGASSCSKTVISILPRPNLTHPQAPLPQHT